MVSSVKSSFMHKLISSYMKVGMVILMLSLFLKIVGGYFMINESCYVVDWKIIEMWGVELSYDLVLDWISMIYGGVVMLISGSVIIYSEGYMKDDPNKDRFLWLLVLFIMSSMFMVFSGGSVSVILGWDGLGLVSYLLVIYYQSSSSYKAGMITVMLNRLGDVMLLMSIAWMVGSGEWGYFYVGEELEKMKGIVKWMVILGACTKSAQIPFSAWLPQASAAPTPVSSLVHSSTLVTAGLFLLIRWSYLFGNSIFGEGLLIVGLLTSNVGGIGALVEMDLKKLVAMSTLSQLGLMMFLISVKMESLAYFHMIVHAYFKALMFMSVGVLIYSVGGGQDCREFLGKKMYFIAGGGLMVSVLCLGGFPYLCGFYSKDLILEMMMSGSKGMVESLMGFFGLMLSGVYGMRLVSMGMLEIKGEISSSMGFGKSSNMGWGIKILMIVGVIGGGMWMWVVDWGFLGGCYWGGGVIGVGIFIFGLVVFYFLSMKNYKGLGTSLMSFFGMMWYLEVISGGVWKDFMWWSGQMTLGQDMEWVENMSGKGMVDLFKKGFVLYSSWHYGAMNYHLVFILLLIVMGVGFY